MVERSHWRRASTWGVLSAALFVYMCVIVLAGKAGFIDNDIIRIVQGWESPEITRAMKFFSWLGSTSVAATIAIVVLALLGIFLKHRKELLLFTVVVAGMPLINSLLKRMFVRERPDIHRIIQEHGYSFPSGHSSSSFVFYGVLAYLLWRHVKPAWGRGLMVVLGLAVPLCIGLSRIYLGVHYPSDVIGGYLIGGAFLGAAIEAFGRFVRPKE